MRGRLNRPLATLAAFVVAVGVAAVAAGASDAPRFVSKIAASIHLGTATTTGYGQVIAQAPNDDVYYAEGEKVNVVRGDAAAVEALRAPANVLAIVATDTVLYVSTSARVYEYAATTGDPMGSWPLPTGLGPSKPTQEGMALEGSRLWVWTDWATDESGYEYGSLVMFNTTTWTSTVINKGGLNPTDVSANANGFYFLANERIILCEPSGVLVKSAATSAAQDAPLAVKGANVYLIASAKVGANLERFNALTLKYAGSAKVGFLTYSPLATPWGLAAVGGTSSSAPGGGATYVELINTTTGAVNRDVNVPGAEFLLFGSHLSAVADRSGQIYLDRLS